MALLSWSAYFETGIEAIDTQHRYLVDLVNLVAPVLAEAGKDIPDGIDELFDHLLDYAAEHFATEALLMQMHAVDPRHVEHHLQSHQGFVDSVRTMTAAYLEKRDINGHSLLGFVANWLIFHILGEDQSLARQLARIGAGQSPEAAYEANGGADINPAQQALTHALLDMYSLLSAQNRELADRRVAEVNELNLKYKIVADYACDWETWISPAGEFIYCSPACERITGLDPKEFTADHDLLLRIVHPDDLEMLTEHLVEHGAEIAHQELVFRIQRPDGDIRWLEHICQPVFNDAGKYLGRRATNRDITDRIQLQQRLADTIAAAEKATQAKSEFLANMSHEIRTPLNAVIASAMLMMQDITDPKQQERLQRIASSSQHLLLLINDILDLSKIEAGKIILEDTDFELRKVFEMVSSQVAEKLQEKSVGWQVKIDPQIPAWLRGDSLRLGQVLLNYAGNAVKFTRTGSVSLTARQLAQDESGHLIRFEVRDTGCGFDPSRREALFQPFEQEDASTTRNHGGTGLGLAICKQIAGMMSGAVGAESVPGEGSTFWFELTLPAALELHPAVAQQDSLKGRRAILVGCDSGNLEMLSQMLKRLGLHVQEAANVQQLETRIKVAAQSGRPYDFTICQGDAKRIKSAIDDGTLSLPFPDPDQRRPYRLLASHLGSESSLHGQLARYFDATLLLPTTQEYLAEVLRGLQAGKQNINHLPHPSGSDIQIKADDLTAYAHHNLLLVEDNPINQAVALDILSSAGLHAEIADNGRDAYVMADNRHYDLILMDLQMPIMGGIEATRAIRRLAGYETTPILAMTANAFDSDRQQCLEAGMNDHLSKPITPDTLYAALRQWLPAQLASSTNVTKPAVAVPPAPTFSKDDIRLPEMSGLNVAAGLVSVMGKRARYRELLERLAKEHATDPLVIRENLRTGCLVEARRMAHSLKGVSALLGADEIRTWATAIESDLNKKAALANFDASLNALAEAMRALSDGLAQTGDE